MPEEKKKESVGALWLKKSRNQLDYFTGSTKCANCGHKQSIVVFENLKKTSERAPDWVMYPDEKKGGD